MQLVEIGSRLRAKTNAKAAKKNAKSANVSAKEKKTPFADDHREGKGGCRVKNSD
jgi:hypothetical protein